MTPTVYENNNKSLQFSSQLIGQREKMISAMTEVPCRAIHTPCHNPYGKPDRHVSPTVLRPQA